VATTRVGVVGRPQPGQQVGEVVISEEPTTLIAAQPIHAARPQLRAQQQRRLINACLPIGLPIATN